MGDDLPEIRLLPHFVPIMKAFRVMMAHRESNKQEKVGANHMDGEPSQGSPLDGAGHHGEDNELKNGKVGLQSHWTPQRQRVPHPLGKEWKEGKAIEQMLVRQDGMSL